MLGHRAAAGQPVRAQVLEPAQPRLEAVEHARTSGFPAAATKMAWKRSSAS